MMCCLNNDVYCLVNAFIFVSCRSCTCHISGFWGKASDPTLALPITPLGTSVPRPSVPTLPPNPGYATDANINTVQLHKYINTTTTADVCAGVELDSAMFMSINPASGLPVSLQCDVLSATRWYCIRSRILNYGLPRSSSTNLDSSAGNRRRVHLHRRCCLGHGL